MNNLPLASCICVTYNRPYIINEMLYCYLNQDYPNKELIILNDQKNIEYYFDDPTVHIYNLKNRFASLGEKRNYSKKLINGDYVFIFDDDDIYYRNHLSRLIEYHEKNIDYDIVMDRICHFSIDNSNIDTWCDISLAFNGASIKRSYFDNNYFPHFLSCGEDKLFIQNANVYKINDDIATFHYRWGLDLFHISGRGGTGIESYNLIKKLDTSNSLEKITLLPTISDSVKTYYR